MLFAITSPRLPRERRTSLPALVSRVGVAASTILTRMRQNLEARAEKLQICEKALRDAGLMTMVPLQTGLAFATIVMRGTSLYGVGVRDDGQWTESAQAELLDRCAQDGLSGVVLMGHPADQARSLEQVEFVEYARPRPTQESASREPLLLAAEAEDGERQRSYHEMSVA